MSVHACCGREYKWSYNNHAPDCPVRNRRERASHATRGRDCAENDCGRADCAECFEMNHRDDADDNEREFA